MTTTDWQQLCSELTRLRALIERQEARIEELSARVEGDPREDSRPAAATVLRTGPHGDRSPLPTRTAAGASGPSSPSRRGVLGRAVAAVLGVGLVTRPATAQSSIGIVPGGAWAVGPGLPLAGYTGAGNTALGEGAAPLLPPNDTASARWNTAIGGEALMQAQPGGGAFGPAQRSSALGRGALRDMTDGYYNDAFGADAGRHSNRTNRNTFLGNNAGKWVGSLDPIADLHPAWPGPPISDIEFEGCRNVMIGRNSGHYGVSAQSCVSVGYNSGAHWLTNFGAVAVGRNAMLDHPHADRTVAVGAFSMAGASDGGTDCVALGYETLRDTGGNNNVAVGAFAGRDCAGGGQNVYIGEQAGLLNSAGSDNVMIGRHAGRENQGSRNIFIGRMAGATHAAFDNRLIIHNTSSTSPFIEGNMGNGAQWWLKIRGDVIPSGDGAFSLGTSGERWSEVWAQDGTINTSDARLKEEIEEEDLGLSFVESLRPVVWKWKGRADRTDHRGFLAQDVQRAADESASPRRFSAVVDEGGDLGLREREFLGPLVKAVQELSSRMRSIEERLA